MFDEPAENKLLKLLKEGVMRETPEEDLEQRSTDNRLLRILRDKKKKDETPPAAASPSREAPRRKSEESPPPSGGGRRDAKSILAASREDADEPPADAAPRGDAASSLRNLVRAAAEAEPPPRPTPPPPSPVQRAVKPPAAATPPRPQAAAPGPPTQAATTDAVATPPRPERAAPVPPPAMQPATPSAGNAASVTQPDTSADAPWVAGEGGLALTLLLKADQIHFIVKMAEGGGLVRTMLVMQCLMGGQGEWGLQGLLQEYARGVTGALNKLMIQEKMRKEVDLGKVKDADLDALLEEIRDTLEGDTESQEAVAAVPGLLLGVRLAREDVAFLRKLASPKGDLTLVSHLIFAQSLMAHEIVPSSPWPQGPAAARIREDFKAAVRTYRELQKTLLNQILVNARLGKKTTWGGGSAEKLESALAELARTLKACLPQGV